MRMTDNERLLRIEAIEAASDSTEKHNCILWPYSRNWQGYAVYGGSKQATQLVHRRILISLTGAPPDGKPNALHTCGNGKFGCINPNHLFWGTQKENIQEIFTRAALTRASAAEARQLSSKAMSAYRTATASMKIATMPLASV